MPFCVNCGTEYNQLERSFCRTCFLDPAILEADIDRKLKSFNLISGNINTVDFACFGERTSLLFSVLFLIFISVTLGTISFGLFVVVLAISISNLYIASFRNKGLMLQVGQHYLPSLYNISRTVCYRLQIPLLPVYIRQNSEFNAYTQGFFGNSWVVLHSGVIENLSLQEISFILGHEFAHIKRKHTTWLTLMSPASNISISILSSLVRLIFNFWSLKCEHTADRGGLIAVRDVSVATTTLMKLATGDAMLSQIDLQRIIKEHEARETPFQQATQLLGSHPFPIKRIKEVLAFSESKTYHRALAL